MTLLQQFIKEKKTNYVPPERKGTPKGDPIGFSAEKYEATLLMLTDLKQKDIADKVGASHGLLRKWNTEELFREEVKRHHVQFVVHYIEYLANKTMGGVEEMQKGMSNPEARDREDRIAHVVRLDELKDSAHYSSMLKELLAKALADALEQATKRGFTAFLGTALNAVQLLSDKADNQKIRQVRSVLLRQSQRQIIREIRATLENPSPSEEERQRAIFMLNLLEKSQRRIA